MTAAPPISHKEENDSQTPDIRIRVNGEDRRLAAGTALAAYLAAQNVPARFVAVAVNNAVVRRADHARVVLRDGDVVEIVRMVGGGCGLEHNTGSSPAAVCKSLDDQFTSKAPYFDRIEVKAGSP